MAVGFLRPARGILHTHVHTQREITGVQSCSRSLIPTQARWVRAVRSRAVRARGHRATIPERLRKVRLAG